MFAPREINVTLDYKKTVRFAGKLSRSKQKKQTKQDTDHCDMFELYGVSKDGMVYHSPPPRRKEVDILEVHFFFFFTRIYWRKKKYFKSQKIENDR